jgi:hypothetical protein
MKGMKGQMLSQPYEKLEVPINLIIMTLQSCKKIKIYVKSENFKKLGKKIRKNFFKNVLKG